MEGRESPGGMEKGEKGGREERDKAKDGCRPRTREE